MLVMRAGFDRRPVRADDELYIGVVDLQNQNRFIPLGKTTAWNWQDAAMAQWLPSEPERTIIYNDRHSGGFRSVLSSIDSQKQRVLSRPIYTLSPDGQIGLSIDFAQVHHARVGYGYVVDTPPAKLDLHSDGIFIVDVPTGESDLLLSYREILQIEPHPIMEQATHWLQHLKFTPSGSRFVFLHRFSFPSGEYYTRVITANRDGTNPHCLLTGSASHFCWKDDTHLLIWGRQLSFRAQRGLRSILKRYPFRFVLQWLHRQRTGWIRHNLIGDQFLLMVDEQPTLDTTAFQKINWDGHPSFSPDGRWLVIDTYPDNQLFQSLYLFDTDSHNLFLLGRFYASVREGVYRCDLHPRWSRDGRHVCIDSTHEGTRQMYVLDLSEMVV